MSRESSEARLAVCEQQIRTLRRALAFAGTLLTLVGVLALSAFSGRPSTLRGAIVESLQARELVVVDSAGTVRARIGGSLPDAVIDGRRVPRGEHAAGVLLYDRTGTERSGYVTFDGSDVVGLTLDNHGQQAALFAAGPTQGSGATARLWRQNDWAEMKVDEAGPHISVGRKGSVAFIAPPITTAEATALCADLKQEIAQVKPAPPASAVLAACKAHAPDAVCRKCLGKP
jgi:hypothetical protein